MPTSDPPSARQFTNRLAGETSPYLLQHAHNPVDWYPWGAEALAAAKDEDKPIFLSIGYAACHWCHVMERESFEDLATAEDLRRDFIAIKVDREERPDLDQVYMAAVQAMTGGGGWPMSVFLTPAGRPFYGGTYFPPVPTHGLPAFRQVLAGVAQAWREDRASVEASGARLVDALVAQAQAAGADRRSPRPEPDGVRSEALSTLESGFDTVRAGWGGAPKFPPSMTLGFLLRTAAGPDGRVNQADPEAARALAMAIPTLDAMAAGGIHDQLGGGFHRYSTDRNWLVPHFEQMLYDNAQLALAYLDAWRLTGEPRHLETAHGVLDFMATRLRRSDGGFAASLDADTDGVEGSTFTWTATEIRAALGPERSSLFEAAYGVTDRGNWEGRTILARVASTSVLADRFGREAADVDAEFDSSRRMLIEIRDRRPQPNRDDKALAAWNGLAIAAFADAGSALQAHEPEAAERFRTLADDAATTIVDGLWRGGRLSRSWKDGRATADGVLEDYADLANGLLSLYEATFDERWFLVARELGDAILDRFADPAGGFFDTADDAERLVSRPKDLQDNAVPSGGAMAATALLRLAALTGETRYRSAAEAAIAGLGELAGHHPTFFGQWLIALGLMARPPAEVAIVGSPENPATQSLLATARRGYRPSQVVAVSEDPATSAVPLLQGRFALNGRPTAFVCRDFACRQPVNEPAALDAFLTESRAPSAWG